MKYVVLVCGGRNFADQRWVFRTLDALHKERRITKIVHGGARGADTYAHTWAATRRVPVIRCLANWELHRRAAGPIRNSEMLRDHSPDLVVAFPGGDGTADMIKKARAKGIEVLEERF